MTYVLDLPILVGRKILYIRPVRMLIGDSTKMWRILLILDKYDKSYVKAYLFVNSDTIRRLSLFWLKMFHSKDKSEADIEEFLSSFVIAPYPPGARLEQMVIFMDRENVIFAIGKETLENLFATYFKTSLNQIRNNIFRTVFRAIKDRM